MLSRAQCMGRCCVLENSEETEGRGRKLRHKWGFKVAAHYEMKKN